MPSYALTHVADDKLVADLAALARTDRQTTAMLLAHIAEVDARELYLPAACASMHVYCVRVLHLAEEVAYKRIRAARVGRRFPQILDAIADGRLHVSGVVILAPHITDDNVDALVAEATHRSKVELEVIVARLAPRPDLPAAITAIGPVAELQLDPDPVAEPPARLKALAPERFALQVTIDQETRDKLERARALMRHRNPSGDLAQVIDRALDVLLVTLEKEKFGATSRPRAGKARPEDADPRYVPNDVKRAVHARDAEQCAFVSESGERCTERGFLENDHRTPVALGGKSTVPDVRLLCRAHNQYEAERILGADFMHGKREEAKAAREAAAAARAIDVDVTRALVEMGFKTAEVRAAMAESAQLPATSVEQRLRTVLAALMRTRAARSSEGPYDWGGSHTESLRLVYSRSA